jgi:adenylylsulfate kinase-like enzyme
MTGLTGVDDPYEEPLAPEVVVPTHEMSVDDAVELIVAALR